MRHTVVLSDVHLWEAVAGDGLWMRYRQRRYFPDEGIAALLTALTAGVADGDCELVLDGDVFDFDVPRPDGRDDTPHTAPEAAACVDRILDDHPVFVGALAGLLARGHRVVFVSGNHDAQLAFPAVRARIVERLEAAVAAVHPSRAVARVGVRARVLFRAWFHRTRDGIHVEHGHQYDPYCAMRYPQTPFRPDTGSIQPTLSSLSMRHLAGRFGYFNPNADATFLLTLPGYAAHWARYYLFTSRSLVGAWIVGTLRVVAALLRTHPRDEIERALHNLLRTSRETASPLEAVSEHATLFARQDLLRAARVLRVDLVALAGCAVAVAFATLAHRTAGLALAALCVAVAAAVSRVWPEGGLDTVYASLEPTQREIARIHGARAVVFGHTHIARGAWRDGVFVGNCGTWAPMFHDIACARPVQSAQPFVWLRSDGAEQLAGGLYRWDGHAAHPVEGAVCDDALPDDRDDDDREHAAA